MMHGVFRVLRNTFAALLVVGIVGQLAAYRWYQLYLNETDSVPGRLFLVRKAVDVSKGDTIVMSWRGGGGYPAGTKMLKVIEGVEGEAVNVVGQEVYVADRFIGEALAVSPRGTQIKPIASQIIPAHHLFLKNPSQTSFDSRYAAFGLVSKDSVVGRAHRVF
jgi:conjugative transfer signal peptidase TraF